MPPKNTGYSVRNPIEQSLISRFMVKRELRRVKKLPRHESFRTDIFGPTITGVDGKSFYYSCREIFRDRIYEFRTDTRTPRILDIGSNVRLSLLFFKHRYPKCNLSGFEPDPNVCETAQHNLDSLGLSEIELLQKAVWIEDTSLSFHAEGADGGHIESPGATTDGSFTVEACDLRSFRQEPIDFLKMDI